MSDIDDQRSAQRRIIFGPLAPALAALALPEPILMLGSRRSLTSVPADAFGAAEVTRFDGVAPHNPRAVVTAAQAIRDAQQSACIVAIGSSSAMDLGKALAYDRDVDLVLIPTALGGAEMTRTYGVVDGDVKGGGRLKRPAGTIVYDAALLATLPARELGSIGINGWAHAIEAGYARTQHALGGAAALAAGRCFPELLLRASTQRGGAVHRALFEAAHLAGFALDTRSMGLHHAACHVIGGITGIPHGIVNAIVLPHALRANEEIAPDAVAAVADAFGIDDLAAAAEAIARAYDLPRTFAELHVSPDMPERALPRILEHRLLDNNPARPDENTVRALLRRAYGVA